MKIKKFDKIYKICEIKLLMSILNNKRGSDDPLLLFNMPKKV